MNRSITRTAVAVLAVASLTATAGCGASKTAGGGSKNGTSKNITIGYIPWDEDVAVSNLWKAVLEKKGYKVTLKQLDVAPTFVGLSKGDVDVFMDGWLPTTHSDYYRQYKDKISDLGVWYDNAKLSIAVPKSMKIDSIEQLPSVKNQVGGKIVGIEPGAGLTRVTKNDMMPGYGLTGWNLQTSSTAAMLTQLQKDTKANKPVVVTLWHPHWAYTAYPIKDLKDPKGKMGSAEKIHSFARKSFPKDQPQVTAMLKKFTMNDQQLADLENEVLQKNKSNPSAGVQAWLKKNSQFEKSLG